MPIRELITNFIEPNKNETRGEVPEKRHRVTAAERRGAGRELPRDTQHSSREMRHGKRLLTAGTRGRGMETVLTAFKDLPIPDVFFHLGIARTGVLH